MPTACLLAAFLVFSAAASSWSCARSEAQPPPEQPTPQPMPTPTPPAEPIEPPAFEPPTPPDDPGVPTPDPSAPCCYTHPQWSGVCAVRPARDETCASILDYLNDPRTTGKTYCSSTDIRGGWKPVTCEDNQ